MSKSFLLVYLLDSIRNLFSLSTRFCKNRLLSSLRRLIKRRYIIYMSKSFLFVYLLFLVSTWFRKIRLMVSMRFRMICKRPSVLVISRRR